MSTETDNRVVAVALIILIFLAVLGNAIVWLSDPFSFEPREDSLQYHTLAMNLSEHGVLSMDSEPPFSPSLKRAPLYPAFIAVVYSIFGTDIHAAKLIQIVFAPIIALMVFVIARQLLVGTKASLFACFLVMIYPGFLETVNRLLTESLMTVFLLATTTSALFWYQTRRFVWMAITGLCSGLMGLIKPEAMLACAFLGCAVFLCGGKKKPLIFQVAVLIAISLSVNLPWLYRNFVASQEHATSVEQTLERQQDVTGQPGLVRQYRLRSERGLAFRPERFKYLYGDDWKEAQLQYNLAISANVMNPQESDVEYFLKRPGEASKYLVVKFMGLFTPSSWSDVYGINKDFSHLSERNNYFLIFVKGSMLVFDAAAVLMGFVGLFILLLSRNRLFWLVASLPIYFVFVYTVVHGIGRYRLPFMPLWIIFALYPVRGPLERYCDRVFVGLRKAIFPDSVRS